MAQEVVIRDETVERLAKQVDVERALVGTESINRQMNIILRKNIESKGGIRLFNLFDKTCYPF